MHAFDVLKATPLLDISSALGGASPIDPATRMNRTDLVELAPIEERAVSLAHVDDRAGHLAEVHAIHQLAALKAGAYRTAAGVCLLRAGSRPTRLDEPLGSRDWWSMRPATPIRADAFECRGLEPGAFTRRALEEVGVAGTQPRHLPFARRTPRVVRFPRLCAISCRAAVLTEGGAVEEQPEAGRACDRGKSRMDTGRRPSPTGPVRRSSDT